MEEVLMELDRLQQKVERERIKRLARIELRAQRLALWWPLLNEPYEGLISRREESASTAGFDDRPAQRPCECRLEWRVGRLCLACDNRGWRSLTKSEREAGLGVDPYSAQVSSGITIVKDESPSARRAREAERNDQILEGLRRDARVRAGLEVEAVPDPSVRQFHAVARKPFTVQRILQAIEALKEREPRCYELLPSPEGFRALAELMDDHFRGQLPEPLGATHP